MEQAKTPPFFLSFFGFVHMVPAQSFCDRIDITTQQCLQRANYTLSCPALPSPFPRPLLSLSPHSPLLQTHTLSLFTIFSSHKQTQTSAFFLLTLSAYVFVNSIFSPLLRRCFCFYPSRERGTERGKTPIVIETNSATPIFLLSPFSFPLLTAACLLCRPFFLSGSGSPPSLFCFVLYFSPFDSSRFAKNRRGAHGRAWLLLLFSPSHPKFAFINCF